ncbi:zinc metalloproteinase nas-6-like isoform X2 [Actinia tenebrosa]|uniref:Metalloendopeptidase n=1 Tax=Actinia tenebrosa TaxID=6105 RepID=A0A6P8IHI5_ACTTE|nr:zinc metalloproteinase nas-6-like isoform X2 [Actinia tenebrosa]
MVRSLCFFVLLPVVLSQVQQGPIGAGQIPDDLLKSPESHSHLFHGDIKLTPAQELNMERYGNPYGTPLGRAASSVDKERWPNAVIPYEFDCSIANMESAITSVKRAMAEWEAKTCIRFKPKTTETAFLQFFRGQGCWGHVGHTANYMSQISIGDNCDFHHVMTHEIGHSVGFWHEQSRPDRDNSIQVLWENVLPGLEDAFAKRSWGTEVIDYGSKYDFASIMHYPFTAFSKNGKPTIRAIADMQGKTPYVELSPDDAMQTNAMYKCDAVMRKRMADDFEANFKPLPRIVKRSNTCSDKSANCQSYKDSGLCNAHADSLIYWCPVTCDMCSSDSCMDKKGNCKAWVAGGHCQTNPEALKIDCPYSCNFCGTPNTPPPPTQAPTPEPPTALPPTAQPPTPSQAVGLRCADKRSKCPTYAQQGECVKSGWVFRNCLISCKAKCDTQPLKPDGDCANALGLGWDFTLPDSAFTSSSTLTPGGGWSAPAHSARLYFEDDRNRKLIGGWCMTARDNNQWLKIDLGKEKKITGIATQGRDVFYEHVEKYELEFSRDGSSWTKYPKVFNGNCDHFTPVLNRFNTQVARYVRVLPYNLPNQYAWPCMRVELYGC